MSASEDSSPVLLGPMKVLHVAETAQGGVGSYLEDVTSLQCARYGDDSVRIVMPREHAAHFSRLPQNSLRAFPTAGQSRLGRMLRAASDGLAQIREWKPDVVHLHSTFAGFALRPIIRLLTKPPRVVYCAHGWAFDRDCHRVTRGTFALAERVWSSWADAIICISRHDLESAKRVGISPARLIAVINGVRDQTTDGTRAHASLNWPPGALRVLFVGRLDQQKGADILLKAMHSLEHAAFAFVVGSSVVNQPGTAPSMKVPPNVQLLGWLARDQLAAHYATADVVVVPSRWEGFGLVAVEAMRSGKAVVASCVGGLSEVVADGETGILIDPMTAEALAEVLRRLDQARLASMGRAARARFEQSFRVERVVEELDRVYRG